MIGRIALGVAAAVGGLVVYSGFNARRAERLAPRDGRMIDVTGARLHYVDMGSGLGSGPAIVMIHGLGGQLRNFSYALADRLAGSFRIVLVDRPGAGYSTETPGAERGLHAQAAVIGRLIRALDLKTPLVVGHSLGGAVALTLAVDQPAAVGGLALIAPLTQPVDAVPAAFARLQIASPAIRRLVAWTLAAPLGKLTRAKAQHILFGPDPAPDDFETRGGGGLTLRPSAFYAASSEVCHGTDELVAVAARYPDIALPVGILYGRGDRILDPAVQGERTAAAIPGAEIELIDGGHMIPLTAPDTVADFVRRQAARIG